MTLEKLTHLIKPEKLTDLVKRIEALPAAQRLLLAAQLMIEGKTDIGITIAENVVEEHRAEKLFSARFGRL